MKNDNIYNPIKFFFLTYLVTWISWFLSAYFSYRENGESIYVTLMIPDVGFMFIAYNLRRIMNIVGKKALKKYLEMLILLVSGKYRPIRFKISLLKAIKYLHKILTSCFEGYLNRRKFDQNLLITEGF